MTGCDIVMCAGQSNMAGRGVYSPYIDGATDARIWQYGCDSTSGNFQKILNSLHPLEYTEGTDATRLGAAHYFALNYVRNRPGRNLLLVPVAQGSTSLVTGATPYWSPFNGGGYYYLRAIARANEAVAAAIAQFGSDVVFRGIGWLQGENDQQAGCSQADYETALIALAAGFRSSITGASGCWFSVLQMASTFISTAGGEVDAAHQDAPNNIPNCVFVAGPRGAQYDNGDNLHYGAAGQRVIGAAWYNAINGWAPIKQPSQKGSWNVLPLGCGGLVTGLSRSSDGTMVCSTDVGNAYRWSGVTTVEGVSDPSQSWLPVITYETLPAGSAAKIGTNFGAYTIVVSPSNSNFAYMIAGDDAGANCCLYYTSTLKFGCKWSKSTTLNNLLGVDMLGINKVDTGKIAIDPANPLHILVGMPVGSGKSYALWQSYMGGASQSAITSLGDATVGSGCTGICFDASSGTTTVSGVTVTNRALAVVGGSDIYQTTDGGVTFTSTGFAAAYGSSNFYVRFAVIDAAGNYYVSPNAAQIWRLAGGVWTNITGGIALVPSGDNHLVLDPNNPGTLHVFGLTGIGIGYKTTNANTGNPPTWTGRTYGQVTTLTAPDYDIGYLNYIFGQGSGKFTYATNAIIDSDGVWWWGGNQSIWYFSAPPDYAQNPCNSTAVSFGRGMECTVAQDVYCPVGGTYPVIGVQDLGGALRGTFDHYPVDVYDRFIEYTCENVEEAADESIAIVRATGQAGVNLDISAYSEKLGEDGSWKRLATTPTSLWQASVVGSVSGSVFTVTSVPAGQTVQNNHWLDADGNTKIIGQTSGTTGKEGVYTLDNAKKDGLSGTITLSKAVQGGQTVAIDKDHWLACPSGYQQGCIPAFTANAMSPDCAWNFCSVLPDANWMMRSWVNGSTSKPFAVGYGSDLGTAWGALGGDTGTIRLFKSTDSFATWAELTPLTGISVSMTGIYLLSVPGQPGELWLTGRFTGGVAGLWHSTDSGATFAPVTMPSGYPLPIAFTLGAPRDIGGYPSLYLLCWSGYGTPQRLFEGQWDGTTMAWSLFGPTGTQADLPPVSQVCGFQSIRGDMNVYNRLYAATNQCGYAFHEPHRPSVALAVHA